MKASGNGAPEICVQNLLKTIRGEVPYERIKGIDRTLIDKPSETAATDLAADVEFLVETYEPRVKLGNVERYDFYELSKKASVVFVTGEDRLYGNILLTKGCVI